MRFLVSLYLFILVFLAGCVPQKQPKKIIRVKSDGFTRPLCPEVSKNHTVTIWVHGTIFMSAVFHSPPGLCQASLLPDDAYLKKNSDFLSKSDPKRFPLDNFYMFGWSGNLSFPEREKAGATFYQELKKLTQEYEQKHGVIPKVRVITHSHGGNVVLNVAKAKDPKDTVFCIDELILLACPIQKATVGHLKDPLFKRIYSLYSNTDIHQVGDPQGLYPRYDESVLSPLAERKKRKVQPRKKREHRPLFSARCFPVQENAIQARLRIDGRSLFHGEMATVYVVRHLPVLLDHLEPHLEQSLQEKRAEDIIYSLRINTR
jgi:hypothetical protein